MQKPDNKYCRYCSHCIAQDEGVGVCEETNAMVKKSAVRNACQLFDFNEIDAFYFDRGVDDPTKAIYKPRDKKQKQCDGQLSLEF